jgi:predicted regulator of Ras-like GTPase activity (Roadblock/LC7/MglB family)
MGMKEDLAQLMATVPGALGAILVDWEGEEVDHVAGMDAYDLKVIGAYSGAILMNLRATIDRFEDDTLEELVLATAEVQTIMHLVTRDYFLVFACRRDDEVLGRALFAVRRCALRLRDDIL